ncbi:TPA: plasmid transfer ATPase TraJ [Yersinia enterocolitica]
MTFKAFNFKGDTSSENFKRFFVYASQNEVSDILIQGGDYIWVEQHGRQYQASTLKIQDGVLPALVSMSWGSDVPVKVSSGLDQDRNLEISGEEYGIERGQALRFRTNIVQAHVARQPTTMSITMRIIPSKLPTFESVHLEEELKNAFYPRDGLILVCGPTGSGKTTLQAAVYHHAGVYMPNRKVITYEDPIEFVLGGDHWTGPQPAQSQVGRDVVSFAAGLRNAMRRAPKIVGIGEARDIETFSAMNAVATSGHLCYATLHVMSCGEAIPRIIQAFPSIQQPSIAAELMSTLRIILVQNLLRTTDGKRAVIREYIIIDRELRNTLQSMPFEHWGHHIRSILEEKGATLIDAAWKLFVEGRIDKEEFIEKAGWPEFEKRTR